MYMTPGMLALAKMMNPYLIPLLAGLSFFIIYMLMKEDKKVENDRKAEEHNE